MRGEGLDETTKKEIDDSYDDGARGPEDFTKESRRSI